MTSDLAYVYFVSLGCAKNFVDTEVMAAHLVKAGIGISDSPENASVFCINTCAFISPARKEAEEQIAMAVKWKKKNSSSRKIIVTGCLTQWDKNAEYFNKYPEIDLWLGTDMLPVLHEKIIELTSGSEIGKKRIATSEPAYLYDDLTPRLQLTPLHYAYIKIADGCNNHCSYCAIPSIRGRLRSRSISSVVAEAANLLRNGVRELIIIAQDITAFGTEGTAGESLAELIRELDRIDGRHWIRLHYLHPKGITDELINAIRDAKHVLPYLDIPLQHVSDGILKKMNRKITKAQIEQVLHKLKSAIPELVIRTTFLVGFPGETEDDFNELCGFIEKWKFERLGVFPYYPEKGTASFEMPSQVTAKIAAQRAQFVQKIHRENSINFNKGLAGRKFDVIIDSVSDGRIKGRTYMDSPEIDNIVLLPKGKSRIKKGQILTVEITGYSDFSLMAKSLS